MPNKQPTILIAEDEAAMLNGLRDTFTKAGFKVILAHNGKEAVSLFRKELPDIVMLDIIMPHMDGLTALEQIKTDPAGKDTPVILLTNLNPNDRVIKIIVEHQPTYYLIKSNFTMEEVLAKAQEALAAKAQSN